MPSCFIWLIYESQGLAGITQIYTLQQAQLIRWESGTPLSSVHRAPSDNLFSRRRLHVKGWMTGQNPEGPPAALLSFFLPEKMSSWFPSQRCHFLAVWTGANKSARVVGSSSVQLEGQSLHLAQHRTPGAMGACCVFQQCCSLLLIRNSCFVIFFKGGYPSWESLPPLHYLGNPTGKMFPGPPSPPPLAQERMPLLLLKVIYLLYSTLKSIFFTTLLIQGVHHFVLSPGGYPDNDRHWP